MGSEIEDLRTQGESSKISGGHQPNRHAVTTGGQE
jgi:hypothetical protein